METAAFISGCLGIALSTLGIAGFAIREHRVEKRRTLSELAVRDRKTLIEFGIILWICGTLIAVDMFFLILPKLAAGVWLTMVWVVVYGAELLLTLLPAYENKIGKIHNYLAYSMGGGMLALTLSFMALLTGTYVLFEGGVFCLMIILGILGLKYWEHFLYFQLPFIFLSHMSILIAAIAVR